MMMRFEFYAYYNLHTHSFLLFLLVLIYTDIIGIFLNAHAYKLSFCKKKRISCVYCSSLRFSLIIHNSNFIFMNPKRGAETRAGKKRGRHDSRAGTVFAAAKGTKPIFYYQTEIK